MTLKLELERLQFYLTRLRCPAFLNVPIEKQQSLSSCAFRRTLLQWLFAIYRLPSVRLVDDDESWTKHEPSPRELLQWLRLMGAQDPNTLIDGALSLEHACTQLLLIVECVHGRVLLEERGEQTCLSESFQLLDDIARHAEDFFDARCELFPVSIQLISADGGAVCEQSKQLAQDVEFIDQQTQGLEHRIESAKARLRALTGSATAIDSSDAKTLSEELGTSLRESLLLIEKASAMMSDKMAQWTNDARPELVDLGTAAAGAYERIDKVLAFFENTEDVVDRLAPDLRDQLDALEKSVALIQDTSR